MQRSLCAGRRVPPAKPSGTQERAGANAEEKGGLLRSKCQLWGSRSVRFGETGGQDGGAGLDELLFGRGEGVGEIAFDVEFGGQFLIYENGDDDFRLHQRRAREITRIFRDILNHDNFATGGSGAAQSPVEGNAGVRREAAGVRSDDEIAGVGGIDEIKTCPVVTSHFLVKALGHQLHEGVGGGSDFGKVLKFLEKVFVSWDHVRVES